MYVDSIILNGGLLIAGQSPSWPFAGSIEILLTNTAPISISLPSGMPPAVARSILVFGNLQLYGEAHNTVWTRLARTAKMGENLITLRERIDLSVGDEIVITTTDSSLSHTERHRVASIINSTTLRLVNPLGYTHLVINQVFPNGRSIAIAAAVGLLTRNIRIRSTDSTVSSLSGWNMFISQFWTGWTFQSGSAQLSNVQFSRFGILDDSVNERKAGIYIYGMRNSIYAPPVSIDRCAFIDGYSTA